MRFIAGLITGLLALGGYLGHQYLQRRDDACLGRCGPGTVCTAASADDTNDQAEGGRGAVCLVSPAAEPPKRKRRRRRRRRARRRRVHGGHSGGSELNGSGAPATPALKTPTPGELRSVSKGQTLGGTDYIDAEKDSSTRELTTAEVTAKVRRLDRQIVGCIDRARGDYALNSGRVVLRFRVERDGAVRKVRVAAPALMQRSGIYGCIRRLIVGLRFPRSSRSLVMTYPYRLE